MACYIRRSYPTLLNLDPTQQFHELGVGGGGRNKLSAIEKLNLVLLPTLRLSTRPLLPTHVLFFYNTHITCYDVVYWPLQTASYAYSFQQRPNLDCTKSNLPDLVFYLKNVKQGIMGPRSRVKMKDHIITGAIYVKDVSTKSPLLYPR